MQRYKTIVVVHPGAIGDAVMGTPVALTLRKNFPDARIVYLTHASLFPLLELCGSINLFLEWSRHKSVLEMSRELRDLKPDLMVDLVGSLKTRLLGALSGARTLTFKKQKDRKHWQHVAENYLNTLSPLGLETRKPLFPSLEPSLELMLEIKQDENLGTRLVALVPGVGKHRPNRAWLPERWAELGNEIVKQYSTQLVLVGGADDDEVCTAVAQLIGPHCLNVAGRMSLPQTAALLSQVEFVVSADTGPAHIAAAVGRSVICLMGPTDPARTGPYGMVEIGLNRCDSCKCMAAKRCLLNDGSGAGECMKQISVTDVLDRLKQTVPQFVPPNAVPSHIN